MRVQVITVPVHFNSQQRTATAEAGASAGLQSLRLLHGMLQLSPLLEGQMEHSMTLWSAGKHCSTMQPLPSGPYHCLAAAEVTSAAHSMGRALLVERLPKSAHALRRACCSGDGLRAWQGHRGLACACCGLGRGHL